MGGLSATPKEQLDALQVMATLAATFKNLDKDFDLEKLAKDVYALPAAEQAKADEARAQISANKELLAGIKVQQAELLKTSDKLDEEKAALEAGVAKLANDQNAFNKRSDTLDRLSDELNAKAVEQAKLADFLASEKLHLEQGNIDLDKRRRENDAYEVSLKETAEQVQQLTKKL